MKFFRLDLLTLLISLFILNSCKNPDGIGLGISPAQTLQANLVDTATITAVTAKDDSVLTNSIVKAPLSYFKDPIFGTTEANIAASLNLPGNSAFTLPTGSVVVDSAILVLPYADGFYGDSLTTKYKVNVYQLKEPLVSSKSYYNTKVWKHDTTAIALLGTKSFYARPKDSLKVTAIVTGAADTLQKVPPQIRVPIDPNFIYNKFFGATTSQLTTNSIFLNSIYGLYITLDKTGTKGGSGGTIYVDMTSGHCAVEVHYHVINGSVIDTSSTSLPVGNPHAVEIKHDYKINPDITNQTDPLQHLVTASTVYLDGLSGLRVKIGFPYLSKLLPANLANNDIVLNKAELVVTPVAGTDIPFVPTPRLTLYRFDIAHQKTVVPDANSGDARYLSVGSFGGFYDHYHRSYSFIITGYIEDLIRNKTIDYGTFLAPCDTTGLSTGAARIDISNSASIGGRTVVGGNKASPYKMKLNIIFNKVAK